MAINLSALSTATTTATGLGNLILINPNKNIGYQPNAIQNPDNTFSNVGKSFLFDYEGENAIQLTSDITDHYIEDNTAIQDHIALRPEIITVHGYVGELNDIAPPILEPLKTAASKLLLLEAYTPALSITALIAYNTAAQLYVVAQNLAAAAVGAFTAVGGSANLISSNLSTFANQNKQQTAFQMFYGYWNNRQLFTVQTPWAIFYNMAILSLRAVQDPDTRVITDFEIQFKQINFASTTETTLLGDGRNATQSAGLAQNGSQVGTPSTIPYTTQIGTQFGL